MLVQITVLAGEFAGLDIVHVTMGIMVSIVRIFLVLAIFVITMKIHMSRYVPIAAQLLPMNEWMGISTFQMQENLLVQKQVLVSDMVFVMVMETVNACNHLLLMIVLFAIVQINAVVTVGVAWNFPLVDVCALNLI